jgi:ribonuclease D
MTRRQLAYLRELWHWRDAHARKRNKPAFKIFGNEQIFGLVRWLDLHPDAPLEQGPKLPRNIRDNLLRTLEDAARRAARIPPEQWPERKHQPRPEPPSRELVARIDALRAACAALAQELAIAPQVLAPRAALQTIAREQPQTVAEIMAAGGLLRWQAELVQRAQQNVAVPH